MLVKIEVYALIASPSGLICCRRLIHPIFQLDKSSNSDATGGNVNASAGLLRSCERTSVQPQLRDVPWIRAQLVPLHAFDEVG